METKYTLTEEQRKEIEQFHQAIQAHQATIELLSLQANRDREIMWQRIKTFVPQVKESKSFSWCYNHETGTVEVENTSKI